MAAGHYSILDIIIILIYMTMNG